VDEVVLGLGADELGLSGGLSLVTREVVGGLLGGSDTLIDADISAVVSAEERVLEALRIVEGDGDLAVLASVGDPGRGTDLSDVTVEQESEGLLVGGEEDSDGVTGATSSTEADVLNVDLGEVDGLGSDERAEGENTSGEDSGELHFELRVVGFEK